MTMAEFGRPLSDTDDSPVGAPNGSTWTPRFSGLFALIAILGGVLVYVGVTGIRASSPIPIDLTAANQAGFIESVGVAVLCLIGLWQTRNQLIRAGLILQWGAVTAGITIHLITFQPITAANSPTIASTVVSLGLLSSVLNFGSLICFSYGMVPWRQEDRWFVLVQLLLTLGLGWALVQPLGPHPVVLEPLTLVCDLAAVMVLLARPACWQARPLTTFCFTVGTLVGQLYYLFFFRQDSLPLVPRFQMLYGLSLGAAVLFLLGLLLLIRSGASV
jgi:hypothetical protein